MNAATRDAGFGAEVKRRIMLGTYALSAGYYDAYYGQAQRVRTLIIRDFERAYEQFDVLLSPTSPTVAFEIGAKTADPLAMYLCDVCTIPSNLAGHAAMSVPFGTAVPVDVPGTPALPIGVAGASRPRVGEPVMFRIAPCDRAGRAGTVAMTATRREPWETVIGLEVHCELATASKLFCGCANEFGDEPNTNICPVCLGLPGSLPVLNEKAVEYALRVAEALHLRVPERSVFARKNYFYPDMPKDYQTSQYDQPITIDGWLDVDGARVGITRAHLEEDTGKTLHMGGGGRIHDADYSLVDYNRAGVPLLEIVSEPDIRSAEQAKRYVEELRATLLAIGVSDVKMEEGSLRIDANVSVRPAGSTEFGTRARDQEPQLVAFAGARDRVRGASGSGRSSQAGETRRAGDAPLGRRAAAARSPAARRKKRTTTATSPSPTSFRSRRPTRCARDVRATMPELPAARRGASDRGRGGSRTTTRGCSSTCPVSPTTPSAAVAALKARHAEGRRQLGAPGRARVPERDRLVARGARARDARRARRSRRRGHDLAQPGQGRARRVDARREVAARHRRGAGPRAGERRRRDRARSSTTCSPRTPTSSTSTAPATTRCAKKKRGFLMGKIMRPLEGPRQRPSHQQTPRRPPTS